MRYFCMPQTKRGRIDAPRFDCILHNLNLVNNLNIAFSGRKNNFAKTLIVEFSLFSYWGRNWSNILFVVSFTVHTEVDQLNLIHREKKIITTVKKIF